MNPRSNPDSRPVDLRQFDSAFGRPEKQEPAARTSYEEVPDGFYEARVEDATLSRTHTTGNPMMVWRLRILGPTCQGRCVTKMRVITQKTLPFLKGDLERLGLHLTRLSEVQERMDEMIDREIRIQKKTDPARKWADINFVRERKNPGSEPADSESAWHAGIDDDIPF
ncbi:DUF669 domain-containing protein [Paludibaculum fermentans]|uniref:DUF669 domain-containing protein n=1 Tax=Paludibaculum fermentans TaxID=1473598 RepID=A0A7S7NKU6_PALFE|nr:DUF669 domain-containing protein [Paludibaculum fermentans]QOY84944.1 DUF669 domain-containing protein [Paludibaculum fermentans]